MPTKYITQTPENEPIMSMLEHEYRGKKYIFVATTRSVYVGSPDTPNKKASFKPVPFEVEEEEVRKVCSNCNNSWTFSNECPQCGAPWRKDNG